VNVPDDWPLLVVAAIAAAIAIDSGPNLDAAVPAGVVAVVAAGLLLAGSMRHVAWRRAPLPRMAPPTAASSLRAAFRSGRAGRLSIVLQLDRMERLGPRPDLVTRSSAEDERIQRMPREEFRQYLRERLARLEAADR
jgi:hypothetical protein